jgi:hypothetical protein
MWIHDDTPSRRDLMTTRSTTNAPGLKAILGIVAAVLTYLATQELLELPVVADVVINAVGVGLAGYLAAPQPTVTEVRHGEAGYGIVEVLLVVFLALVILYVLFAIVPSDGDAAVTAFRSSWG